MENNYKRLENESDEELIYRICNDKDTIGTWSEVAAILNNLLGTDFGESTFRKKYAAFCKMFNANRSRFVSGDSQLSEINERIRYLEKERKKIQTEKLEYNRWLREDARDELFVEQICDAIRSLPSLEFPGRILSAYNSDKEWLLAFGDEHFGTEFEIFDISGGIVNAYSPEIFYERMYDLFDQVVA